MNNKDFLSLFNYIVNQIKQDNIIGNKVEIIPRMKSNKEIEIRTFPIKRNNFHWTTKDVLSFLAQ